MMTTTATTTERAAGMVFEGCTADYTSLIHFAKRADGQWFTRYQYRGAYGYAWTAWRACGEPSSYIRETGRKARLPKAA